MKQAVILVHGLWMRGPDMLLLRYRLRCCGYVTYQFSYPTTRCTVTDAAQRLQRFAEKLPETCVHFVAHSLGGMVVQRMFLLFPQQRMGRVVTLGTPHSGSVVARRLAQFRIGRFFLGNSYPQGLAGQPVAWTAEQELGVIAGDMSLGGGRLVVGLPRPNDGTVAVDETRIPGASAYCVLYASHLGLLVSPRVAQTVCSFLASGRFGNA